MRWKPASTPLACRSHSKSLLFFKNRSKISSNQILRRSHEPPNPRNAYRSLFCLVCSTRSGQHAAPLTGAPCLVQQRLAPCWRLWHRGEIRARLHSRAHLRTLGLVERDFAIRCKSRDLCIDAPMLQRAARSERPSFSNGLGRFLEAHGNEEYPEADCCGA